MILFTSISFYLSQAMDAQYNPSLLILGHSFVRRFGDFIRGTHLPYDSRSEHFTNYANLRLPHERVEVLGLGGARLYGPKNIIHFGHNFLSSNHLKILYLDIGSNDLCNPSLSASEIAQRIVDGAKYFLDHYNIAIVIIGQIIERLNTPYPQYNSKVHQTNQQIRHLIAQNYTYPIEFSTFRGLTHPSPDKFNPDGIHLNEIGYKLYFQGVRGAFIRALSKYSLQ